MKLAEFDLSGKTALVTGGNSGIGLAIARGLSRAGARVAICGRNPEKNKRAIQELKQISPEARAFEFDLLKIDDIPAFYENVSEAMNGLDILVNNAGAQHRGRADEIKLEDFDRIIKINLTAPYVLSQCFAKEHIKTDRPGNIIMIASLMSEAARPTVSPYTVSKGGIRQMVKALAVDWAPFGIRINGIGPGYIQTEMTQPLIEDAEFNRWVIQRTPLGRWGRPDDFEAAAVFLASDASKFITGQILYIDGGWLATF